MTQLFQNCALNLVKTQLPSLKLCNSAMEAGLILERPELAMPVPQDIFLGGCWVAGMLVMFLNCDLGMVADTPFPRPGGPVGVRRERVADQGTQVLHGDFASPTATSPRVSSELEQARPQTSGAEELQLQLALAMSREVAEQVGAGRDTPPAGRARAQPHGGKAFRTAVLGMHPSEVLHEMLPLHPVCGIRSTRWLESIWTWKRIRQRLEGGPRRAER